MEHLHDVTAAAWASGGGRRFGHCFAAAEGESYNSSLPTCSTIANGDLRKRNTAVTHILHIILAAQLDNDVHTAAWASGGGRRFGHCFAAVEGES